MSQKSFRIFIREAHIGFFRKLVLVSFVYEIYEMPWDIQVYEALTDSRAYGVSWLCCLSNSYH